MSDSKDGYEELAREMSFAKVVDTADGEALLIGGAVYHVVGPKGNAADLFARALRGPRRPVGWGPDLRSGVKEAPPSQKDSLGLYRQGLYIGRDGLTKSYVGKGESHDPD